MKGLLFEILGEPVSKQSARFRVSKTKGGRDILMAYQTKKVKDAERSIAVQIKSQLPKSHKLLDCPIGVKVEFIFSPLKSWSKKKISQVENGRLIYKVTKPDLTDNLMKGLFDAMEGVVFVNDSRVCKVESEKYYGLEPMTRIEIYEI